jgi:hypothetical protein
METDTSLSSFCLWMLRLSIDTLMVEAVPLSVLLISLSTKRF